MPLDSERDCVPEGTSAAASSSSFLWSSLKAKECRDVAWNVSAIVFYEIFAIRKFLTLKSAWECCRVSTPDAF